MTNRGHFFSATRGLDASSATLPFTFMDNIQIRGGDKLLSQILPRHVEAAIGQLEAAALRSNPYFFMESEVNVGDEQSDLETFLRLIQVFLLGLWFVKDHAVQVEMGFLSDGQNRSHSFFIGEVVCSADGESNVVTMSLSELKEARRWTDLCWTIRLAEMTRALGDAKRATQLAGSKTIALKGVSRLVRTMYFLQAARASADIGMKLAHLMTCFEILFSTSEGELTHKLAERVAFFVEPPASRLEAFRLMKDAYSIRSKVVHGDEIKPSVAHRAPSIAVGIDSLLRSALRKIVGAAEVVRLFDGKGDVLDTYFEELIFSSGSSRE